MDDVPVLGVGAALHVGDVFREGGDALRLQAVVLGGEVAIDLGVARHVAAVLAEDVLGEQVLGVAAGAGAHREHDERGAGADRLGDLDRHHLDLGADRAGGLVAAGPPRMICIALSADLPTARKPPVQVARDGIRPTWPITGMASSARRFTVAKPALQ